MERLEHIARIIDPQAFNVCTDPAMDSGQREFREAQKYAQGVALEKAKAIDGLYK